MPLLLFILSLCLFAYAWFNASAAGIAFDVLGALLLLHGAMRREAALERFKSKSPAEAKVHLADCKKTALLPATPLMVCTHARLKRDYGHNEEPRSKGFARKFWALVFLVMGFVLQLVASMAAESNVLQAQTSGGKKEISMGSETTAILVAVVALVATIVGAVIGAAANYVIALRQERAARENDKRRNATETKRATRLVYAELTIGAQAVSIALEQKEWWPDIVKVSSEEWEKYRGRLAPELTDKDWVTLVSAYIGLNFFNSNRNEAIEAQGNGKILLSPHLIDSWAPLLDKIEAGRDALNKFVFAESIAAERKAPAT
jgi:hypothetical protein